MKRTRGRLTYARWLQVALAMALLLASGVAAALGLGQIELKSKLGQPLLAEIPIVSNDPRELQQLRVRLASPEIFARIGLELPDRVVANLQFTSALDARGNPVVRVTSTEPINQPLLTFLVEVDWGQGRLVREYSVLLDQPRTVAAPLQPPIQAPAAAPSNTIAREPESAPVPQPQPQPQPAAPEPLPLEPAAGEAVDAAAAPAAPTPVPAPPAPPVPAPAPAPATPDRYGEVRSGETLSEIAESLDLGVSLDQAMIALLRANPQAFIDNNINLLRQGAVLRVPDRTELAAVDAVQATALVRSQVRQWRQAQEAVPQPVAADGGAGSDAAAAQGGDTGDGEAPAARGARLEIVPPGASDATEAGTQSGIAAGGEGDMQRELATTKETLAAREAELAEMKSRVAELEQLQDKQQQLLEMKDTELAAVQQRLAQAAGEQGVQGTSFLPWVLGAAIGLLLALLVVWLLRRRSGAAQFRAPGPGSRTSLADAFTPAASASRRAAAPASAASAAAVAAADASPATPVADTPAGRETGAEVRPGAAATRADTGADGGDSGDESRPLRDRREHPPLPNRRAPTWHQQTPEPGAASDPAGTAAAPPAEGISAQERLELARAYLDLGDRDSARQLLDEVAINGDPDSREQATRMLRELD